MINMDNGPTDENGLTQADRDYLTNQYPEIFEESRRDAKIMRYFAAISCTVLFGAGAIAYFTGWGRQDEKAQVQENARSSTVQEDSLEPKVEKTLIQIDSGSR